MKNCSKAKNGLCSQKNPQPMSNFYKVNSSYCKSCILIISKNSYYKHREKHLQRKKKQNYSYKDRFRIGRRRAFLRGFEWNISFEEWINLIKPNICHYCSGILSKQGIALDRTNNALGYTLINVVPCCGNCNRIKTNLLSYNEMLAVSKLLKQLRHEKE